MLDLWYKNAIIYELTVESFMDGDGDGCGDFKGLSERLPYLAGLGVTCLWLLPFYPSPFRDDGYDVADYYGVLERFGSSGDFVEFMHLADEWGLRVLVDLVCNHTSDTHPWFQAARRDPRSRFRDFYVWSKEKPADADLGIVYPGHQQSTWKYDSEAGEYYFHRFYAYQPDLKVGNPAVRREIEKIMGYWLQLGVSGFRIDAAPFLIERKGTVAPMGEEQYRYLREFRRFLSWRKGDAIMLAEANVPPDEALNFFGDDDRMQMVFNFVANQHLFLALARGDAAPIREAYRQLPDLPPTAQWASFLRNHDELDLGRLSDEERQDCFRAFAPESGMRLYERGIRRRLAPMLGGNRRRIELAYSLLFSLPGTPVLRYGEEIGMGDDLGLPERESVRTPMQWSDEPNAGFSGAASEALVRPVISSGPYRYQDVNVVAQTLDPNSLLTWTERAIRARKETPEFGWGRACFQDADAPGVLVQRSEWEGRTVYALHNLSEEPRTVRLELPEAGDELIEIFGTDRDETRRRIRGQRPAIELEGNGYRWLRLRHAHRSPNEQSGPAEEHAG